MCRKMLRPFVLARMKEGRDMAGCWVDSRQVGTFFKLQLQQANARLSRLVGPPCCLATMCSMWNPRRNAPAANGSTRNDCRRAAEPPRTAHSCRLLQCPTGLRLPVGEEIIDVGVRFHLSFFLVGQFTFIGSDIQFFNTGRISLGEVEGQNAFSERPSHPTSGQVEHP
jgi:hypothetical protein